MNTTAIFNQQVMLFPSGKDGTIAFKDLTYPRLASIKYDGSYCIIINGQMFSRKLKPITNQHILTKFQDICTFSHCNRIILMGELYDKSQSFGGNQSILRSLSGDASNVKFYIFDLLTYEEWNTKQSRPYNERYTDILTIFSDITKFQGCIPVEQCLIHSANELENLYQSAIKNGEEGIVTRQMFGVYKHGRCTREDMDLFRHTKVLRIDGKILEINPGKKLRSNLQRTRLPSGLLEQPTTKDSYVTDDICGSLTIETETGITTNIGFGKGWTKQDRIDIWNNKEAYKGMMVEVEYKPYSNKDKLRQGKLVRIRYDK